MSMNAFQGVMPHISVLAKGHAAALALHQLIESVDRGERHRILVADGLRPELCEGHIDMHQVRPRENPCTPRLTETDLIRISRPP